MNAPASTKTEARTEAVSMAASRAASAIRPGRVDDAPGRGDRSVHAVSTESTTPSADRDERVRRLAEAEPLKLAGRSWTHAPW